jgi:hypothetical protein
VVAISSSDSLLLWNDDEFGRFASYGVFLFLKSMILNTSLAENLSNLSQKKNLSNEMEGLETDEPRE